MVRFFLAVAPPAPLLNEIDAFRGRWGHPHHKVEPHITIQPPFLWEGRPDPWLEVAAKVVEQIEPFPVELKGTGRFARSRVLFLQPVGDGLERLQAMVTKALVGILPDDGRRPQRQGFHGHITLAAGRFGITDERIEAMEAEAKQESFATASFRVESLQVYRWGPGEHRWSRYRDLPLGENGGHP